MNDFKDIPGYEGLYQVSNAGKISTNYRLKRLLKPDITRDGYAQVTLYKNGLRQRYSVHRVVALCFCENPNNKPHVNHIDGNKLNNNYTNLEWCTMSENSLHAAKSGLMKSKKGSECNFYGKKGLNSHTAKAVQCLMTGAVYSFRDASKFLNVSESHFSVMVRGKEPNWTNFILI